MWEELGISGGTALIVLITQYFVIKWAVKNGIKEAHKEMAEEAAENEAAAELTSKRQL